MVDHDHPLRPKRGFEVIGVTDNGESFALWYSSFERADLARRLLSGEDVGPLPQGFSYGFPPDSTIVSVRVREI